MFLNDLDRLLILILSDLDLDLDLDLERIAVGGGDRERDLFFKDFAAGATVELVFLLDERVFEVDLRRLESLVLCAVLDVVLALAESVLDERLSSDSFPFMLVLDDVLF